MEGRWVRSIVGGQAKGLIDYRADLGKLPIEDMLLKEDLAIRDHLRERKIAAGYIKLLVIMAASSQKKEGGRKMALETGADMLSALTGELIELDLPLTEEELMSDPAAAAAYYEQHTGHKINDA